MRATLLYPPLTDPTCGYLSLSYLASYARARSDHQIEIVDANIEALRFCARPEQVSERLERAREERARLGRPAGEAGRRRLLDLECALDLDPGDPAAAMAALCDPERFYDYGRYYPAALALMRWLRLLALDGEPGQFEQFSVSESIGLNLRNLELLTRPEVLDRLGAPFAAWVHGELIGRLAAAPPDVVGLGVTYHEQLPFALYLAKEIRAALPDCRIVFGGTDVSQVWKFTRKTRAFAHLFRWVDACVVGEGESSFVELLDAYRDGRDGAEIGNVVTAEKYRAGGPVVPRYENLDALPPVAFDDLPWHLYLSPEPMVYYAPTRGCYWDKCTFCDYGLAVGRPTSPWRRHTVERVVDDLARLAQKSRYVYLSVDVIAPAFLVKMARRLLDRGVRVRWGAELRLERAFDEASCRLLAESGCVGISVGFESGNQRVLDLIDKGTRVETVRGVIRNFAAAGVAVQIMGFTDFPTETYQEALDSIQVLEDLRASWVFGGLGRFLLTGGAIVAQDPARFGLASIAPRPGDDVHCQLDFVEAVPSKTGDERREIDRRTAALRHPLELPRPFMGGTDTAHTYFYFGRFGPGTRGQLDRALGEPSPAGRLELRGRVLADPGVDLEAPEPAGGGPGGGPDAGGGPVWLLLEDGRPVRASRLTAELAPLLDGGRSRREVERALVDRFGERAILHHVHLGQLIESGYVRFAATSRAAGGRPRAATL